MLITLLIVAMIVEGSTWRLLFRTRMDDVMVCGRSFGPHIAILYQISTVCMYHRLRHIDYPADTGCVLDGLSTRDEPVHWLEQIYVLLPARSTSAAQHIQALSGCASSVWRVFIMYGHRAYSCFADSYVCAALLGLGSITLLVLASHQGCWSSCHPMFEGLLSSMSSVTPLAHTCQGARLCRRDFYSELCPTKQALTSCVLLYCIH